MGQGVRDVLRQGQRLAEEERDGNPFPSKWYFDGDPWDLGYTPEVAERYPPVARLSSGVATDHPRERVRQKASAGS